MQAGRIVPWEEFVGYGWLIGAVIRTEETFLSQVVRTEGVITGAGISGGQVNFSVKGVDPRRTYEVSGPTAGMDLIDCGDGSYRFHIPYLGSAKISLC